MTVLEHGGHLLVIDVGLMFPTEDMLGVDLVLPDFTYVRERASNVVGVLLTHGHEDHIGGMPYFLREMNPPIYGTKLTLGLLKPKLDEHHLLNKARLKVIKAPGKLELGPFKLRFMGVAHSIPEGVATFVETPSARILHSGDFKLDPSPIDGKPTDLKGIAEASHGGIDLFMSDSTNAQRRGVIPSERTTGEAIRNVIQRAKGRVIVACFASNIHRIQQVAEAAAESGRFVSFLGRSMNTNVGVARELGHLKVESSWLLPIEEIDEYPPEKIAVISTGSQGEPLSALSLMAARDHRWIELHEGDTVVLSATPIPGNESAVHRVIDGLMRIGVDVVQPPDAPVHVSGHAAADELKFMLDLVKPKWFIPLHGEYRHLAAHARLAQEAGVPKERSLVVEDGDVVEVWKGKVKKLPRVRAGYVFVDGLGIGDVSEVVLRDRQLLASDGVIVAVVTIDTQTGELLAGPDLISRGFVYEGHAEPFYEEAREKIRESLASLAQDEITDWAAIRRHVRRALGSHVWSVTGRRPVILPVVMEV